jgi:hypothetical protein
MTLKHAGPIYDYIFYLSNVHSLLLRMNKNPNVRHKTPSLKVTSDEIVTANNWQTRVLRNQFLTKEGIKLQLTESVGSPISLGKTHQHSCSHKRTLSICLALPFQYLSHSTGVNDTQFTVSTAQCSISKWCHSALEQITQWEVCSSVPLLQDHPTLSYPNNSSPKHNEYPLLATLLSLSVSQYRQFPSYITCNLRKHRHT